MVTFFIQQIFYGPKTKFWKIVFWAQKIFLTMELKSVNSISSSFGKTVKRPINHFSRTSAQTAPLGISRFLGPKSKKYTFYTGPNWQYRRTKLPTRFFTIGPNKDELLFGYWGLFLHKKILRPKNQIWENRFLGQKFFLTLELKSVDSISSSFGKTVKRPMNHFSRTSTQMATPAKLYTVFLLFLGQ